MDIFFVFGNEWPKESAGINYTTYTCFGIAKSDAETNVKLIMKDNLKRDETPEEILNSKFGIGPDAGLSMKLLKKHKLLPDNSTTFYYRVYKYLKNKAKKNKVSAVITRNEGFLPYLIKLKNKFGIKVYYEPHQYYLDYKINTEKKGFKKQFFQKKYLPKINGILCHQGPILNLYKNTLPNQNFCLAHSGLKKIIKTNDPWKNKYIAYIGTLDKRKRLSDIIYALSRVKDTSLRMLIIGKRDNENLDSFMEKAKELGVKDRIDITGWLSHSELEETLKKVKIGIVPLEDNFFNRYLTSPMKIFNYLSAGIPVISTDLDTTRDILLDKHGFFYKTGDVDQLVKYVDKLSTDQKFYDNCHKDILIKAEELLWEKRGGRILNFIKTT